MPQSGYPTPDEQIGDVTYGCIPIFVPNNAEFQSLFAAAIYGLYATMSKEWFWREQGTLSPELAAFYAASGLAQTEAYAECGGTVSCDDIADCIEVDEGVQLAINQHLSSNGYAPNSGTSIPQNVLTAAQTSENLLPSGYSCTDGQMMATARSIVTRLNRAVEDWLQDIELITDPAEIIAELGDNVEGISYVNSITEFAVWAQDTFSDVYLASYDEDVENNLSCAIYCAMQVDCEITLDMLIIVMQDAMGAIDPPPSLDDYEALFQWIVDIDTSIGESVVGAYFYLALQTMKFVSGVLPGFTFLADLASTIRGSVGKSDTSYDECDDCPPTETPNNFWYMPLDFSLSKFQTLENGTDTDYQNGGWEITSGATNILAQIRINSFDATTFYLAGVRITSLRRGSNASGTTDYKRLNTYPNENLTGTPVQASNSNFLGDGNAVVGGNLTLADNAFPFKSVYVLEGVSGSFAAGVNFARITKLELWGWNHADVKPAGSEWVSARV